MSYKAEVESLVDSFALGCVAGGRFVAHMRSEHYPKLIMAFFDNCRKKVAIRLLTARAQNYELCLKYSDIRSIAIGDNKMVIRCKYAPLLHEWLNDQGKPAVDFTSASPTFRVRVARMTLEDDQGDAKLVSQELSKTNCLHIQFKDIQPLDDIVHSIGLIEPSVTVSKDAPNKLFDIEEVELNETLIASLDESRFLRIADPDYVIRLLIKDEDMKTLSFTVGKVSLPAEHPVVNHVNQFLSDTIVEQLRSGIDIAGRTYLH